MEPTTGTDASQSATITSTSPVERDTQSYHDETSSSRHVLEPGPLAKSSAGTDASQSANATPTASPVVPDTQSDHDETSSRDIEQPLANAKSSEIDIEVNKIE